MSAVRGLRVGFGFNGSNAYIRAPFDWFGTGDWTVAFWLYPRGLVTSTVIYRVANVPGGTGYFIIFHRGDARIEWVARASNTANLYNVWAFTRVFPGRWAHVAFRRRGTVVNVFVDGVRDGNYTTVPETEEFTYVDVLIGGPSWLPAWLGEIGPVLIYKRALSDAEITMLYNGYVPRDGLALYFDPSIPLRPDGRIEDLSGNGRHGTPYGGLRVGVYRASRTVAPARVLPKAR